METRAKQTMGSRWVVMMFGVGIAGALCAHTVSLAEEASQNRARKTASGWSTKQDKDKNKDLDAVIQDKLQRILANQQTILQKADVVKAELGIIKIRTTTSGRTLTLPSGAACP